MAGKIAEMVEKEAAAAEAEDDTDAEDAEEEEDAESTLPVPDDLDDETEMSQERQLAAFHAENERHDQALAKIMGADFASFAPCEFCDGIGHRVGVRLQPDPSVERCGRCGGEGIMLTGSVRDGKQARDCIECQGEGFRPKSAAPVIPTYTPPPAPMFDPYTGERIVPGSVVGDIQANGMWAPGYEPPATGIPGGGPRT